MKEQYLSTLHNQICWLIMAWQHQPCHWWWWIFMNVTFLFSLTHGLPIWRIIQMTAPTFIRMLRIQSRHCLNVMLLQLIDKAVVLIVLRVPTQFAAWLEHLVIGCCCNLFQCWRQTIISCQWELLLLVLQNLNREIYLYFLLLHNTIVTISFVRWCIIPVIFRFRCDNLPLNRLIKGALNPEA